ncbi:hypothetical protein XHV734_1718 [Xanthomonas hortorum pv. vitians]|nr:hypothetical protein XHV734_1718 [Xanthomonas hortorum pv. vitians]
MVVAAAVAVVAARTRAAAQSPSPPGRGGGVRVGTSDASINLEPVFNVGGTSFGVA